MEQTDPPSAPPTGDDPSASILHNRNFLLIWIAQAVSQVAQQAIWFGMIVVVERVTHSTTYQGIAIMSTIIPGVLFGAVAGVFVDRMNRKAVLVASNFLRAGVVLGYLLYQQSVLFVLAVNFVFVAISQFFGPAEASTIPSLVSRRQLLQANALFSLTFTASQLVGIVLLAPWLIKLFGPPALFVMLGVLYVVAGILVTFLPRGAEPERSLWDLRRHTLVRDVLAELGEAWGFISGDRRTAWAMVYITLMSSLLLVLAELAPRYVVTVIGIQAEDAVYIMAPAGVAIFIMTLAMSRLGRLFGKPRLITIGLFVTAASVGLMAALNWLKGPLMMMSGVLDQSAGQRLLVPPLMAFSFLLGTGFALTSIPAQTVLMEQAPPAGRGRIFAALYMVGNVAAILPLVLLGGLADVVGVSTVLGVIALGFAWVGLRAVRGSSAQIAGGGDRAAPGPDATTPAPGREADGAAAAKSSGPSGRTE